MEVKDALLKRRSVRSFTDEAVSKEEIDELMHAAMSGPSACNKMPWKFYAITNKETMDKVAEAGRFTKYNAPLMIIVCGDLSKALPNQYAEYWIQDCSAATENILLRATDLGLGAVWCGAYPQKLFMDKISKILGLDEKLIPLNVVFVGHPNEEPEARDQYDEKNVILIK